MSSEKLRVSIVTVNYNHGEYLDAYIHSLMASEYPIAEIIVVDNHSSDNSLEILYRYPNWVKVIDNPTNIGYSQALNQAFRMASSSLVCATGPDIVVQPGWLIPLVDQYLKDPEATFAVTSRVFMFDRKTIQSSGGSLHFTGHLTIYDMWKNDNSENSAQDLAKEVGAIDSTSALFDRDKFLTIGGCDPLFFVYHEEFDYCYRARMRGWNCWYHPKSVVYHGGGTPDFSSRHTGEYPTARPLLHTRNRLISMTKNYQLRTIVTILPVMLLVEILNFALLAHNRLHKSYYSAWIGLWRHRRQIYANRAIIQTSRLLPDGDLLEAEPLTISPILMNNDLLNQLRLILDGFLSLYWRMIRIVLYR